METMSKFQVFLLVVKQLVLLSMEPIDWVLILSLIWLFLEEELPLQLKKSTLQAKLKNLFLLMLENSQLPNWIRSDFLMESILQLKSEVNSKEQCKDMLLCSEDKISLKKENKRYTIFPKCTKTLRSTIEATYGTLILLRLLSLKTS
jgi:hypothetical protein